MTVNTKIEWCDHTVNFWEGCYKVSDACTNCYAEARANRWGFDIWGKNKPRKFVKGAVPAAKKLNRKAEKEGVRYRVFSNSLSDFFEEDHGQPIVDHHGDTVYFDLEDGDIQTVHNPSPLMWRAATLTDLRRQAFETIEATPHLDWLLLTKRPENVRELWRRDQIGPYRESGVGVFERKNVWLGTTVENQQEADKRIPELRECCDLSPVLFLSCEPLLGRIELNLGENLGEQDSDVGFMPCNQGGVWHQHPLNSPCNRGIGWVIIGNESGPKRRQWDIEWAIDLVEQCKAAGVPCFVKQIIDDRGKKTPFEEFPAELQVREFPEQANG